MSNKTLLIDGDICLFKFACRHGSAIIWPNGAESQHLNPGQAKRDLDEFAVELLKQTKCKDLIFCFTNPINFRYKIYPKYKSNRSNKEKPVLLDEIRRHIQGHYPWKTQEYLEADDLMGIMGTAKPDKYVLATIDKDFWSLPVTLYDWNTRQLIKNPLEEADYNFHYQWLIGDSTDGYPGCYRIGKVKAKKILNSVESPSDWSIAVVEAYACSKKKYSWEEIITQARMARILRHEDWDYNNKQPILWEPDI